MSFVVILFDSKSGNRKLDTPFTLPVSPHVDNFETLALELEAYLYDLAKQNNTSQDVYKLNFAQWQARQQFEAQKMPEQQV